MLKVHRLVLSLVAVATMSIASASAARAAGPTFTPANVSSLISLFPDSCVPLGSAGVCITFTNATFLTSLAEAGNSNQMGSLLAQGLQDGQLTQLGTTFGITDPGGSSVYAGVFNASAASPSAPSAAAATASLQAQQQAAAANAGLYQAMQQNGAVSPLAQEQLNGTALLQINSELQTQNTVQAQQILESQQAGQTAWNGMGAMLDLDNAADPGAGWTW